MRSSYNGMAIVTTMTKQAGGLAERVIRDIAGDIRSGSLRPGDKLPTEAEVVRRFKVSRTVVREALSKLQAAGLVETRHGVGTFVAKSRREAGFKPDVTEIATLVDLLELMEVRKGVESEAAALAARRRLPLHLATMRLALDEFAQHLAADRDTTAADFRFHHTIAEATGNPYYMSLLESLGRNAIPKTKLKLPETAAEERRSYLAAVNREHEDIFGAIARGDGDGARAAMRNHIGNGRERLRQRQQSPDNKRRNS